MTADRPSAFPPQEPPRQPATHDRYLFTLLGLFLVWFVLMAIHPWDLKDWALESALTVPVVLGLVASRRRLPLSRLSYTLIFIHLSLHTLGSHYTYAAVPYNQWTEAIFGTPLNDWFGWQRNHYDRLVHFSFGLLWAYPIREVFLRVAEVRGVWGYYFPLDLTMAASMLYELIEWQAAEIFGGDLGVAYLGTQGDVWDAQKDMGLATLGALAAMLITAGLNRWLDRDFAREMADSLKVKDPRPYGEDEIGRLWRRKKKPVTGKSA